MKKTIKISLLAISILVASTSVYAWDLWKIAKAGVKTFQAATLTDAQVAEYVSAAVKQMDQQNKVASANSPYTVRLKKLTSGINKVDGIPLNFKVYETADVNAFACADGSVRVYTALMDIMSDDELLGVIGHEIGHVGLHHSRKAIKQELLTGALKDAIESSDGTVAALSSSVLGTIGESLVSAKYSQKQEKEADDYGYEFLKKNNKNPWGMVSAFEKLQSLEQKSGTKTSYITKMFSSHPDTQARIKRLSDRCKKDGIARK